MAGEPLRGNGKFLPKRAFEQGAFGKAPPDGIPPFLVMSYRNLPHWQSGGSSYFITFNTYGVILPELAREAAFWAFKHCEGARFDCGRRPDSQRGEVPAMRAAREAEVAKRLAGGSFRGASRGWIRRDAGVTERFAADVFLVRLEIDAQTILLQAGGLNGLPWNG